MRTEITLMNQQEKERITLVYIQSFEAYKPYWSFLMFDIESVSIVNEVEDCL